MKTIVGILFIIIAVVTAIPLVVISYSIIIEPLLSGASIVSSGSITLGSDSYQITNQYAIWSILILTPLITGLIGINYINTNQNMEHK